MNSISLVCLWFKCHALQKNNISHLQFLVKSSELQVYINVENERYLWPIYTYDANAFQLNSTASKQRVVCA